MRISGVEVTSLHDHGGVMTTFWLGLEREEGIGWSLVSLWERQRKGDGVVVGAASRFARSRQPLVSPKSRLVHLTLYPIQTVNSSNIT